MVFLNHKIKSYRLISFEICVPLASTFRRIFILESMIEIHSVLFICNFRLVALFLISFSRWILQCKCCACIWLTTDTNCCLKHPLNEKKKLEKHIFVSYVLKQVRFSPQKEDSQMWTCLKIWIDCDQSFYPTKYQLISIFFSSFVRITSIRLQHLTWG